MIIRNVWVEHEEEKEWRVSAVIIMFSFCSRLELIKSNFLNILNSVLFLFLFPVRPQNENRESKCFN